MDYELSSGLGVAVAVVLVVVRFGGWVAAGEKDRHSEGMRRSARRGLAVGLGSGLVVAEIAGLGVAVVIVLRGRLVDGWPPSSSTVDLRGIRVDRGAGVWWNHLPEGPPTWVPVTQ